MTRPKKLVVVGGRRVFVDHDSRKEESRDYNKTRWKYDKEVTRFYNSKVWRQLSKDVLLEHDYVCCDCDGEAVLSDHIIPIRIDWEKRLDRENLQPMCKQCHNRKTLQENYYFNQTK